MLSGGLIQTVWRSTEGNKRLRPHTVFQKDTRLLCQEAQFPPELCWNYGVHVSAANCRYPRNTSSAPSRTRPFPTTIITLWNVLTGYYLFILQQPMVYCNCNELMLAGFGFNLLTRLYLEVIKSCCALWHYNKCWLEIPYICGFFHNSQSFSVFNNKVNYSFCSKGK